ncbi:MAG TPA: peptide ABC transporter substrate-binding protein [Caulobacteraceae bacterium]|nr:peptide ABC transporter substrate-binding protein [Caulobacteraceae bacterium]
MIRSRATQLLCVAAALFALGSCKPEHHRPPCPPGALCLAYGNGAEPTTLDPAHIDGTWETTIVSQLLVGLTERRADGGVEPALARSWQTSADGLTWTFRLRDAEWSDGEPVTADDFVYAMHRELDPKTASASAFLLYDIVKNAKLVNAGKLPTSAAGIEAPDAHTLVLHLEHPWPNLPEYLTGRTFWPQPRHVVARWGDAWTKPEHYVADGPYILVAWRLGDAVVLRKNPRYWDRARVCYSEIDFSPTPDATTNERSERAGDLDISTTVQSNRVQFLRRSALARYLRLAPEFGVSYLSFNLKDPQLEDERVRQALSMAIDRDFITRKLLRAGQRAAYSFVPDGMPGYTPQRTYWADWSLDRRQAEARRLLAAAGYGPAHPLKLVFKHFSSPDSTLIAPAVQSDWKALGVDAELRQEDAQVAYQDYENRDFQVGYAGWIANDPYFYLDLDRSDTGANNFGGYANHAFDHELDAALAAVGMPGRAAHLHRAEAMLLADAPVAPLYFVASGNLVNPLVAGWVDNPINTHPARALCRLPQPRVGAGAATS